MGNALSHFNGMFIMCKVAELYVLEHICDDLGICLESRILLLVWGPFDKFD